MTLLQPSTVRHIGNLANLPLSEQEVAKYSTELSLTVSYVQTLSGINTKRVPPTYQTGGQVNRFRDDETTPSLSQEDALKNASRTYNGYFVVKAIWD